MFEMKLAYYKGRDSEVKKRFVTGIIRLFTGRYSHVELVFPDEMYKQLNSFSSSGWDGGVRYKRINFSHPDRWAFQSLGKFSIQQIGNLRAHCDTMIGKKYATLDVIRRFGLGKAVNDPEKYWCSEACIHALNIAKIFVPEISENLAPTRMKIRIERRLKNEQA